MATMRKLTAAELDELNGKHDLGAKSAIPVAETDDPDTFIIGLTKFIKDTKGLTTRRIKGKITAATQKAIMVEAHAYIGESDTCHRCGRELTHPASRVIGYGIDCVWEVGLGPLWERYADTLETDPAAFREIQQAAQRLSIISDWLPLTQISIRRHGTDRALRFPADQAEIYELFKQLGLWRDESAETDDVELHYGQSEWNGRVFDNVYVKSSRRYVSVNRALKDRHRGSGWDANRLMWRYPLNMDVVSDIMSSFGGKITYIDPKIKDLYSAREERQSRYKTLTDDELTQPAELKAPMWTHQKQALAFGADLRGVAYLLDMGTGKTLVAIAEIIRASHPNANHLIIAPKAVVRNTWPDEIRKFADIPLHVCTLTKGGPERKTHDAVQAQRDARRYGVPFVLIVNYESAYRDPLGEFLLMNDWDTITADEIHRIKAPGGVTSRFMAKLSRKGKKRLGLTGTPMPHSPLDVWAQYRFIDPSILQPTFNEFRSQYANVIDHGMYKTVNGYRNQAELNARVYSIGFRVTKHEALDLPDVMHTYLSCDLEPTARKMYESLKAELVAQYTDDTAQGAIHVSAKNILVKLLKLQQITSGHISYDKVDEDGNVIGREIVTGVSFAKKQLLMDTLEDIDPSKPVVIITRYKADIDVVREAAEANERPFLRLDGDVNDLDQYKAGTSGNGYVIAVNERSGGVGVNLTWSGDRPTEYCIFYSLSYSLGDFDQTLARVHRGGMGDVKIQYIHLRVANSIDEKIYQVLESRRDDVEFVLDLMLGKDSPSPYELDAETEYDRKMGLDDE